MPTVSPRRTIIDDISQAVEQSGGGGGPQLVPSGGSTVRTEKTPAEDTPGRECPHDVFGLPPHKGTMWMSNDRVALESIESLYGGGVSSLPGANGDLLPVMFLVVPVLLTYPKQSALGVSLDSGLMGGMSRPEPLEQSVLGALSVVQLDETDTPERLALTSQMNHKQSRFKSSAGEFSSDDELGLEILEIGCAAVSAGCQYPRSSSHGGNIQSTASEFAGPCAGPGQWICDISTSSEPV